MILDERKVRINSKKSIIPPPKEFLGLELHANVEGLEAPVIIDNYKPKLLGVNLAQAEMGAFAALIASHCFGAGQATPIVQAIYQNDIEKATALSSLAQSESAEHFADFIFTVFSIAKGTAKQNSHICDLRKFPYVSNSVDMLYRYQPIIDQSLIPYSGGKILAESDTIQLGDIAQDIVAHLGNTQFLILRMTYVHTQHPDQLNTVSSHLAWVSHGVWGEPILL